MQPNIKDEQLQTIKQFILNLHNERAIKAFSSDPVIEQKQYDTLCSNCLSCRNSVWMAYNGDNSFCYCREQQNICFRTWGQNFPKLLNLLEDCPSFKPR